MIIEKKNEKIISFLLICEMKNWNFFFLFLHEKRKIKKKSFSFHIKEEKLKKISVLLTRNVRFCLFFIDKNVLFSCKKGNWKNSLPFSHAGWKVQKKVSFSPWGKGSWKKFLPFPSLRGHPDFVRFYQCSIVSFCVCTVHQHIYVVYKFNQNWLFWLFIYSL